MTTRRKWIAVVYFISWMLFLETSGDCQTPAQSQEVSASVRATVTSDHLSQQEASRLFKINNSRFLSAYEDVVNILKSPNSCSDFFGSSAVDVFKQFAARLTTTQIPQGVGIRMSGGYELRVKHDASVRYRLFDKAEINVRGAFYIASGFLTEPRIQPVGPFTADTRQARIIMLLHELGHLIEAPSGNWLLPDDGTNDVESRNNTWNVAKHCERVIRAQTRSPQPRMSVE